MRRVDQEALRRALKLTRAEPGRDQQIARMFEDGEPWESIAHFCAYLQQCRALSLKPWQSPPCWLTDEQPDDEPRSHCDSLAAWQLRRRLIAFGLSPFEPDPLGALHAAEEAAKRTA